MEIFSVLLIVLGLVLLFKLFSAGLYILSIPIKIIFLLISIILSVILIFPLGIFAGVLSILMIPFTVLLPLFPIILIIIGIALLAKHSN